MAAAADPGLEREEASMISVAMAVYNGEMYLQEQLDSIFSQTDPVDEIVIVDDCSSDGTMDIIQDCLKTHPEIRLYRNDVNLGYKKNFRKAVSLCRGDIIFLCDQDDRWFPDKVKIMTNILMQNPDIEVLSSSFEFMDSQSEVYAGKLRKGMSNNNMYLKPVERGELHNVSFREFCSHNYFQGCSLAVRKETAGEFLSNWTDRLPHDWLIALLASHDHGFWFLNIPLFFYRTHTGNTIGVPRGRKHEEWVRLKFAQDMLAAAETIQKIWPEEYENILFCKERIEFCRAHIEALKKRQFMKLLVQNLNPFYRELKTGRARVMDLLFCLIPRGKT